jgi:hypothetical protein
VVLSLVYTNLLGNKRLWLLLFFTFPCTDLTHCSASMLFQVILPWTRIQGQRTLCLIELSLCMIHLVKLELSDCNLSDTIDNEESVVMY